jgi:hypothetical protein
VSKQRAFFGANISAYLFSLGNLRRISMKVRLALAIQCLMVAVIYAQTGVAGKWRTAEQPNPELVIRLDLETDGAQMSGTVTHFEQEPRQISNGKVDGPKLSFETAGLLNGEEVTVFWNGEVRGDELMLSRRIQMSNGRVVSLSSDPHKFHRAK